MRRYINLEAYQKENAQFLNQPIVKSFLENEPDGLFLLESAFVDGDMEAKSRLDKKFVRHFYFYRVVKYISILSHHFSIDFDKQYRKQKQRYLLLIDQHFNNEESDTPMIDFLSYKQERVSSVSEVSSLIEMVEDEVLYNVLIKLTKKEKDILHLLFVEQLKQVEVAELFGETPQNIAKVKKKVISKVKREYKEGVKRRSDRQKRDFN
jgi:RNA polymerase sigma factor (sigma-70 family)